MLYNLQKKVHDFWSGRHLVLFSLMAVLCASSAAMTQADALYILTGAEDSAIVLDSSKTTEDFSSQLVYLSSGSKGYDATLTAGQDVTILYNGETLTTESKKETVSALLERMDITPGPLEMVSVDFSDNTVTLTVSDQITYYDEVTETVTYETIRRANPNLPQGTEKVVQEGKDGVRTAIYEVVWSEGQQVSRQFVEELDSTAVNEIVEYGTGSTTASATTVSATDRIASVSKNADGSGTLTFASGATLNFSGVKSMTATAYTAGHDGVGYCTATGTTVRVGTVAVDKNVIPLGTRMYIVASDGSVVYGMAVAEDTGVKGNKIDLYHDTYQQCINFGRRTCTVYILE